MVSQDSVGVITFASKDYCIVSVGEESSFVFSQSKLYSSGSPCRGDMTRILKEGKKVKVCYDPSESNQPVVRAVWVGKRPTSFATANIFSSHIYNQQGFVIEDTADYFLVKRDYGARDTVLINKQVIYGLERNTVVSIVKFDAVPLPSPHSSGASFRANCAWIGENQPKLVDRFGLETEDSQFEESQFEGQIVRGTVVVIPNEIVAFARVDDQRATVMLFCSSFNFSRKCRGIRDLVSVGDLLFMRMRPCLVAPGRWQLCAERAWKDGERYEETVPNQRRKRRIGAPAAPPDNVPKSVGNRTGKLLEKSCGFPYPDPGHESYLYEITPFTMKCSQRRLLLNCTGVLGIVFKTGKGCIKVEHDFGTSVIDMDDPILRTLKNNEPLDLRTLKKLIGGPVCCDIEKRNAEAVVQRIWLQGSSRPSPEYSVSSQLEFEGNPTFSANLWYSGIIVSVPLNDAAIAQVSGVPVLVTLESLVVDELTNTTPSSIDVYLKVNDHVALTIRKVLPGKGFKFFKAGSCMSGRRKEKSTSGDKFEIKSNRKEIS